MKNTTKHLVIFFLSVFSLSTAHSQSIDYNLDSNYLAEGYDIVSYFMDSPQKGKKEFIHTYKNVKLKFINSSNLNLFKNDPEKFLPQYGGWCAYAMGEKGKKVTIDPETYEIREGKLYLFYNSWGTNTLKLWLKENPIKLRAKAVKNWNQVKLKS